MKQSLEKLKKTFLTTLFGADLYKEEPEPKPSLRDIGANGTPDDIITAANAEAGLLDSIPYRMSELALGAAEALKQNRPENLQTLFAAATRKKKNNAECLVYIVSGLTVSQVQKALEAQTPEERQKTLDGALIGACGWRDKTPHDIETLVKAGANANAQNGRPLLTAVIANLGDHVRKLYELGADFDIARAQAEIDVTALRTPQVTLTRLDLYRKTVEAETAPRQSRDDKILDMLERLQRDVAALRAEVQELKNTRPAPKQPRKRL